MDVLKENRLRDLYLRDGGNVIFIPKDWCDEWEVDPEEQPEIASYAPTRTFANSPVETLFVTVEYLNLLTEVTEAEARVIHPKLFETLKAIDEGVEYD